MLKRCKIYYLVTIIYLFYSAISLRANDLYPVNSIISHLKLEVDYRDRESRVVLKKGERTVQILFESPYIMIGDDFFFLNDLPGREGGQLFLPLEAALELFAYFSPAAGSYYVKNGLIVYKDSKGEQAIKAGGPEASYYYMAKDKVENVTEKSTVKDEGKKERVKTEIVKKGGSTIIDKASTLKINAIVIDAGHGGKDPGTSRYGINEKDIVLRTALILAEKLKKAFPTKKIILTRNKDIFIPLEERAELANSILKKYGASLFLSIHVNASVSSKPYGFETWYIIDEYRKEIIGKGEVSEDTDVEYVLNSMLNEEIYLESRYLAQKIQDNMAKKIGNVSRNRGIKESTYIVIKEPILPAVLIEIGFVSNKTEANRLTKYSYLSTIADGILNGIREFVYEYESTKGFTG